MPLIDDRGRLLGTVNLIDAFVGVFLLGLIPLAYGAFLLFRVPDPRITSISPTEVVERQPATVEVVGEELRPFLRVRIGSRDLPFLIESPTRAEIKVPELAIGTYDLVVYDEAQELFQLPGAIRVIPVPVKAGAIAIVRARFAAGEELLDLVKVGDVDVGGPGALAGADGAVLTGIGSERQTVVAETTTDGPRTYRLQERAVVFSATLRVPVVFSSSGWTYKGRPVKVGAPLVFETMSGAMGGWILEMRLDAR